MKDGRSGVAIVILLRETRILPKTQPACHLEPTLSTGAKRQISSTERSGADASIQATFLIGGSPTRAAPPLRENAACPGHPPRVPIPFMPQAAPKTPAARFARLIAALCEAVAARVSGPARPGLAGPLVILIWTRLRRMARRVERIAARLGTPSRLRHDGNPVVAGALPPPRPRPATPRRTAAPPCQRLPRGRAWLVRLAPAAACGAGQLQALLDDPGDANPDRCGPTDRPHVAPALPDARRQPSALPAPSVPSEAGAAAPRHGRPAAPNGTRRCQIAAATSHAVGAGGRPPRLRSARSRLTQHDAGVCPIYSILET